MEFEEKINRLVVLLPYNSSLKLKEEFNVTYNIDFSSYCIDDAIAYARTYAVNPNSNNYPVYSSDCTNFAAYSCAMKSHFRKSGNQMSGKWKSSYASLLA